MENLSLFMVDDCVHGPMRLPDYIHQIVATEEFRRLRNVKQLGATDYIFKNAVHSRYEHCIGVSYLCQRILNNLERNSGIQIDDSLKKCVIIAGLLHDLGHGPFSHLWDSIVCPTDPSWSHEEQSKRMVEFLFQNNNIRLSEVVATHNDHLELITALITGNSSVWKKHLTPKLYFLTEIVNNKYCHIDVDKCDYLLRDAWYLKHQIHIKDFIEFLDGAKVVYVVDKGGKYRSHIGYRSEDFELIENLFENRKMLHMEIYQNHDVIGCEKMIQEMLVEAGKHNFMFKDTPLVSVHNDNNKFRLLDDTILKQIHQSKIANMERAKKLYESLDNKEFWLKIWESEEDFSKNIIEYLRQNCGNHFVSAKKEVGLEVPKNVPLYDANGLVPSRTSTLKLSHKSNMIFCKDTAFLKEAMNLLNNNN